jgi:hypothetical protein
MILIFVIKKAEISKLYLCAKKSPTELSSIGDGGLDQKKSSE